jgi:hypothetical protein
MATLVDMAGNTLITENIRIGATNPGDAATDISSAELTFLDGAAATNAGTNKAVITGTSGAVTLAGAITASSTYSGVGAMTILNATAVPAGGTAGSGYKFSSTSNLGVFFGSGAPTLSAAQGSLYMRTDGSSTSTRLYVNTNGTTGWTNVTTAT